MGIGVGVVLFAIGAILAFAVTIDIPGVTDDTLGIILMIVGIATILLAFAINHQRANTSHVSRVEERRIDET